MSKRNRMTRRQATDRKASAPPATPGYGTEDQDHPAHTQPDPGAHDYENGDTSSWAEDVRQPPYPDGNPPADPGYDVEDQDHPAHKRPPRLPKSAGLGTQVVKKADKCIRLARHTLGKEASVEMVEDQALDYMDMPDQQLDATLNRLGGGFLAQDDLYLDEEDVMVDDLLSMEEEVEEIEEEGEMACGGPKFSNADVMAQLKSLAADMAAIKSGAGQNDPNGETLAPKPQSEEQERAEGAATAKGETTSASNPIAAMFDQYDRDNDGFVTTEDWKGSKSIFASLDTDNDGIIAREEVIKAFYEDEMIEDDLYDDLDPDEAAMLAEMMDDDGGMDEMVEEGMEILAKKSEDEEDEDKADKEAAKSKGKKSDDDEDEDDEGGDSDSEEDEGGDEDQDEEADEDSDKEASIEANMFSMSSDPMGLSSDESVITEDDSLLMSIFGGRTASDDEDGDDEDGDEDVEASDDEDADEKKAKKDKKAAKSKGKKSEDEKEEDAEEEAAETIQEEVEEKAKDKKASQRPQPKKASKGVQKVGHVTAPQQSNEISELAQLWDSEPDVSGVFGVKSSS